MVVREGVEGNGEIAEVLENNEKTLGVRMCDDAGGEAEVVKVDALATEAAGTEAHCGGGCSGEDERKGDVVWDGGFVVFWVGMEGG